MVKQLVTSLLDLYLLVNIALFKFQNSIAKLIRNSTLCHLRYGKNLSFPSSMWTAFHFLPQCGLPFISFLNVDCLSFPSSMWTAFHFLPECGLPFISFLNVDCLSFPSSMWTAFHFLPQCGLPFISFLNVDCLSFPSSMWTAFHFLPQCGLPFISFLNVDCLSFPSSMWTAFHFFPQCGLPFILNLRQGSHGHGKSWKILKFETILESHGKVMDFCLFSRSHGKLIFQGKVMEFYTNRQFCARCMAMAVLWIAYTRSLLSFTLSRECIY